MVNPTKKRSRLKYECKKEKMQCKAPDTCLTDTGILLCRLGANDGLMSTGSWACLQQSEGKKRKMRMLYQQRASNTEKIVDKIIEQKLHTSKG